MARGPLSAKPARQTTGLALLLASLLCLGHSAAAQAIDLKFRPPDISPESLCVPGPTDSETIALWEEWDGKALPDRSVRDIRRDIARLGALDGVRWFDTTWRAIELLESAKNAPDAEAVLLMRIFALENAGRFDELAEGGYVRDLAARNGDLALSSMRVLSDLMRDGIGLSADPLLADDILVEAGYGGDVHALRQLAERQMAGTAPEGWDLPVEVTVTTAFTVAIGELDSSICERAQDIAVDYRLGRIVEADPQIAHDWYRFAADLGDAHAAWRVVKYHETGEGIARDNDLFITYLEKAANAGLPHAQIELARTLESGALAPRDLPRAKSLLQQAAASGDSQGLVQYASFLRRQVGSRPDLRGELRTAARALTSRPDAPGWAFRLLAEAEMETKGFLAARETAINLLRLAADHGDSEARLEAARLSLAEAPTDAEVDRALDDYSHVLSRDGGATPVKDMMAALICRAHGAIDATQARYWRERFAAITGGSPETLPVPLMDLRPDQHPREIASIQSGALNASPTSRAEWRRMTEDTAVFGPKPLANMATREIEGDREFLAQISVDLSLAQSGKERETLLARLRSRHHASGAAFAGLISASLFDAAYGPETLINLDAEESSRALATLSASAEAGFGRAMMVLARSVASPREIHKRYGAVIEIRGDYAAQVFAARLADDPQRHVARAMGTMPCTFQSVMEMSELARDLGNEGDLARWLEAADLLADGEAWRLNQIADAIMETNDDSLLPRAVTYLDTARKQGDPFAAADLFSLLLRRDRAAYEPERAIALLAKALELPNQDVLPGYLDALSDADAATRAMFNRRFDMMQIHRSAANSGDAKAMRIFGLRLREDANDAVSLGEATAWIQKAAEAGDVPAMFTLGEALAYGIGVSANRVEALDWLDRAAESGSQRAEEITRLVRLAQES